MRPSATRALASAALLAVGACPRPAPQPSPAGGEPELRVALAVGVPSVVLGGEGGGELVAQGPPEAVAQVTASYTGKYLRDVLARSASDGRYTDAL